MFSYETIQLFNDLELVIYNYIMKNSSQVQYMTIRELADAVHVSTSSIMRFCKKAGCRARFHQVSGHGRCRRIRS